MLKYLALMVVAVTVVAGAPKQQQHPKAEEKPACRDIAEGSECDPFDVDCDQCDWCENLVSYYFRCDQHRTDPFDPFVNITGTWKKEECPEGYLVDRTRPLTSGAQGGQCTAWAELDPEVVDEYFRDEDCKLLFPCLYGVDSDCTANYWFQLNWEAARENGTCAGNGDIFDLDTENCKPCSAVARCAGKGDCQRSG